MDERQRGLKYIEGYVERKELSKFAGRIDLGPRSSCIKGKKKGDKFYFEVKSENFSKHMLRVSSQALRQQWLYAIELSSKLQPPEPFLCDTGLQGAVPPSPSSSFDSSFSESELSSPGLSGSFSNMFNDVDQRILVNRTAQFSFDQHTKNPRLRRSSAPPGAMYPIQQQNTNSSPHSSVVDHGAFASPQTSQASQPSPHWYLGQLSRDSAIDILNKQPIGTYLVRDSETAKTPGSYTLSLRHRDKCRHHKIETQPQTGHLYIKNYEKHPFPNLELLVHFFVKTQSNDIKLTAYAPPVNHDGMYEVMDEPEDPSSSLFSHQSSPKQSYENMPSKERVTDDLSRMSIQRHPTSGHIEDSASPPLLPRKQIGGERPSYQNMPPKHAAPPPPQTSSSYENLPSKAKGTAPPGPPLPPRGQGTGSKGYENVVAKPLRTPPHSPRSYENIPEREHGSSYQNVAPINNPIPLPVRAPKSAATPYPQSYQNIPPKAGPTHGYQNLPPKVAPRRVQTFHSDTKPVVKQRTKPPLVRRSLTQGEGEMQSWTEQGH
ncbi:formin-like protein 13 isoform X2 [Nematostella vectensis]|uniref:formin-like protein 13 isoform X2 n=1 Tax=Nematostella vectensis TaxID=45351 RepID=UPI002077745F|nr:formin-like protein 13 isoform X2 [Nematostella vectensis]